MGQVSIATVRDLCEIENLCDMRCGNETEIELDIVRQRSRREVTADSC
jgi:hypothetical protein